MKSKTRGSIGQKEKETAVKDTLLKGGVARKDSDLEDIAVSDAHN